MKDNDEINSKNKIKSFVCICCNRIYHIPYLAAYNFNLSNQNLQTKQVEQLVYIRMTLGNQNFHGNAAGFEKIVTNVWMFTLCLHYTLCWLVCERMHGLTKETPTVSLDPLETTAKFL